MTDTRKLILRKRFQKTDLRNNNHKFWIILFYDNGDRQHIWGRVKDGVNPEDEDSGAQRKTWHNSTLEVALNKIAEKVDKKYEEIKLETASSALPSKVQATGDNRVDELVKHLLQESGEHIQSFMTDSAALKEMSLDQIDKGRKLLDRASRMLTARQQSANPRLRRAWQWDQAIDLAQAFYNTIPMALPAKIDSQDVARNLLDNIQTHLDRLDQLEQAVLVARSSNDAPDTVAQQSGLAVFGGAEILDMQRQSPDDFKKLRAAIRAMTNRTLINAYNIHIPHERIRFKANKYGAGNTATLFHGTQHANIPHILRSGLRIMSVAANGSRFGRGLYFADNITRSLNYVYSDYGRGNLVLMADVHLGKHKRMTGTNNRLRSAPTGYESIFGDLSRGGIQEWIVYFESQVSIKGLLEFE